MCQIQIKFVGLFLADLWRAQVLIANHLRCSNNKIFLSLSFYLFNKRELSGVQRSSYSYWAAAVNQFDFQFTTFRINHLSTIPQTKFEKFSLSGYKSLKQVFIPKEGFIDCSLFVYSSYNCTRCEFKSGHIILRIGVFISLIYIYLH